MPRAAVPGRRRERGLREPPKPPARRHRRFCFLLQQEEGGGREGAVGALLRGLGTAVPLLQTRGGEKRGSLLKLQRAERGISHVPVNT